MTYVAVDWSGAKSSSAQRKAIWLAEVDSDGKFRRVRPGYSRDEVTDELVNLAEAEEDLVVGLDFGFSFPKVAFEKLGLAEDVEQLWGLNDREAWLDGWDVSSTYPLAELQDGEHFRGTEHELFEWGLTPRSTIDLNARTGNVGRQSVRGFDQLKRLRGEGFAVWPFDEPNDRTVVEIYPRFLRRWLTENLGDRSAVTDALKKEIEDQPWVIELAEADENARDAILSAWVLREHFDAERLPKRTQQAELEGYIWRPADLP